MSERCGIKYTYCPANAGEFAFWRASTWTCGRPAGHEGEHGEGQSIRREVQR